jgi:hypothetical protein
LLEGVEAATQEGEDWVDVVTGERYEEGNMAVTNR